MLSGLDIVIKEILFPILLNNIAFSFDVNRYIKLRSFSFCYFKPVLERRVTNLQQTATISVSLVYHLIIYKVLKYITIYKCHINKN